VPPPTPPPPTPTTTTEPISLREAARRLGVHYMTAYRYVRTGRLPARRNGQEWLIDPGDLSLLRDQPPPRPGQRAHADRVPILVARMTAGDEAGAWRIVDDALASGMDVTGVYLDLLVPALRRVGAAWAEGTISIAGEHRASAVAQRIIGRLGPQFARRGRKRGTVVTGGPAGEQHGLPGAIISDLLRGRGFEVIDLGANTPADSFAETAQQADRLVAVVIGVTAPGLDDSVRSAVAALAGAGLTAPVLVGGSAITGPGHARELGADAWTGPDGRAVLAAVDRAAADRAAVDSGAADPGAADQGAADPGAADRDTGRLALSRWAHNEGRHRHLPAVITLGRQSHNGLGKVIRRRSAFGCGDS
jgi:excisionase family DNA binding protein